MKRVIRFSSKRIFFFAFSLTMFAVSIAAYFINGGFNLGVDFTGGTVMEVGYPEPADEMKLLAEVVPTMPQPIMDKMIQVANQIRKVFVGQELLCETLDRCLAVSQFLLDAAPVHPREVFRPAVQDSAAAVILAHNHPSGDPTPSAEDLRVTRQLIDAGTVLGIRVLDHVIIGRPADGRPAAFPFFYIEPSKAEYRPLVERAAGRRLTLAEVESIPRIRGGTRPRV
jgi:proteasome lid subunit RPN8/RPN11